jgi:hypothetical protein
MGLFAFFGGLIGGLKTLIEVVVDVGVTIGRAIQIEYHSFKKEYSEANLQDMRRRRFHSLKSINDEILDLERFSRGKNGLSSTDRARLEELGKQRSEIRKKLDTNLALETAEQIVEHEGDYGEKTVDPKNPNDLTRLGGQVVFGKACRLCKRPMSIRWRNDVRDPTLDDLYWGCTGFFIKDEHGANLCKHTERMTMRDKTLFAPLERPGMDLSSERLNNMILRPETSSHITARLESAVGETTEHYLCPVHHEQMKLRQKADAVGLLDLYYFKCDRCDQIIKIKSGQQLDAVLDAYTDHGVF